jgi:hypothetical protein
MTSLGGQALIPVAARRNGQHSLDDLMALTAVVFTLFSDFFGFPE